MKTEVSRRVGSVHILISSYCLKFSGIYTEKPKDQFTIINKGCARPCCVTAVIPLQVHFCSEFSHCIVKPFSGPKVLICQSLNSSLQALHVFLSTISVSAWTLYLYASSMPQLCFLSLQRSSVSSHPSCPASLLKLFPAKD